MKVLVADDDPVSRRLLEAYLVRWGYEVSLAVDGAEGWRMFEQDDFPLVISDWTMPNLNGLELIRKIRSSPRGGLSYAILVTSKSQKEDVVEGMEAGADDFVSKPFDRDELRVRLREGERTVRLERTLADQNQTLHSVQAALLQNKQLCRTSTAAATEIAKLAVEVSDLLSRLQHDLVPAAGPSNSTWAETCAHGLLQELQQSLTRLAQIQVLARQFETEPAGPNDGTEPESAATG
jgi:two-component system, NtrC family, sensor kinase